jgi:hypothetical protein
VDDPAVATVDATGLVTAVAEGTTTLRAQVGGLEATESIEVRADGLAYITILDAYTGAPLEGATVSVVDMDHGSTDASGAIALAVTDGGPVSVSVFYDSSYQAVTYYGTVSRQFTIPLWPLADMGQAADLVGDVDFSGVDDADWDELVVGFAASTHPGSLASLELDNLFSPDRSFSVLGVDVSAPANLFVEGIIETYDSSCAVGAVGAWGLAGPFLAEDASSGLNGAEDALELVAANAGNLSWGFTPGGFATSGSTVELDLAPSPKLSDTITVDTPALSLGFQGTEQFFLLTAEERADEGWVPTGLGVGNGSVDIDSAPAGSVADSLATAVYAYAQVGGLGSGGATVASVATEVKGAYSLPELQDVPVVDSWSPATRDLTVTTDAAATFLRVRVEDAKGHAHDLFMPNTGTWTGNEPNIYSAFARAKADVIVTAVETVDGHFEDWVSGGDLEPATKDARTFATTTLDGG